MLRAFSFLSAPLGWVLALCLAFPLSVLGADIDWQRITRLEDRAFLDYFETLDLHGQDAIDFWKKIPLSRANRQVNRLFHKEAFGIYMNKYPGSRRKDLQSVFQAGMGTEIVGPISNQRLKLPFTDFHPLPAGPVGNPGRIYRIGYSIHGLNHPWLLSNADSALWEANRHPNVDLQITDAEFDNEKQVAQIDAWINAQRDGILVWPMQEAPMGPPIARAQQAGIPLVTVDRMAGTRRLAAQVTGNFPANGAQQGVYLVHRLLHDRGAVKGRILMIRKPLGSTADSMRTGHFLKVISYFPKLQIIESKHNNSSRADSRLQVLQALKDHGEIDVIFCTGAEQAMGAVAAVDEAGRWNSGSSGNRIIVLSNDDLYESLLAMRRDRIAVTVPYTPLLGGLGLRVLLKAIAGDRIPRDITTPDLPMITKVKQNIFGIETLGIDDWLPYSYGRSQAAAIELDSR